MINFELITDKNEYEALKLKVYNHQNNLIETVKQCLEEAKEFTCWSPIIIKYNNINVGFAMYGLWVENVNDQKLWLDRFFIDKSHQNKGLAKPILNNLLNFLFNKYNKNKIYLSVYRNNELAIKIYKELGFVFNGELDINGEKVMVKKLN